MGSGDAPDRTACHRSPKPARAVQPTRGYAAGRALTVDLARLKGHEKAPLNVSRS